VAIASTLLHDLNLAKALYIQKRDHFRGLCILYAEQRDAWDQMDRKPRQKGKETESVYRHCKSKGESFVTLIALGTHKLTYTVVPSQAAIYQHMLAQESKFSDTDIPQGSIAAFLNEGLRIQDAQ
jgi:hypothetical protein